MISTKPGQALTFRELLPFKSSTLLLTMTILMQSIVPLKVLMVMQLRTNSFLTSSRNLEESVKAGHGLFTEEVQEGGKHLQFR